MSRVVLALDQGTSSTRGDRVRPRPARARAGHGAGRVRVPGAGPRRAGSGRADRLRDRGDRAPRSTWAASRRPTWPPLSIANQTETFVIWERETGRPIHPAIVWQDRRTSAVCDAARRRRATARSCAPAAGSSSTRRSPRARSAGCSITCPAPLRAAEAGELAYGDVASWLVLLADGRRAAHVSDAGNAGRTMLCALGETTWDAELLDLFGVPAALLPPIVDSDAELGHDRRRACRSWVRSAISRPRSSASAASGRGEAKVTLGTGGFLLVQGGTRDAAAARRRAREHRPGDATPSTSYALEGFVPVAGAAIDWLVEIGVLEARVLARRADRRSAARRPRRPVSFPRCRGWERRAGTPMTPRHARRAQPGDDAGRDRARHGRRRAASDRRRRRCDRATSADRDDPARRRPLAQHLRRAAARRSDGRPDRACRARRTRRPSELP